MAIRAATRKVLSPISEKMIMVKESTKEWKGWITPAASSSDMLEVGGLVLGAVSSGSALESEPGTGCGRSSCGVTGRSVGFCSVVSCVHKVVTISAYQHSTRAYLEADSAGDDEVLDRDATLFVVRFFRDRCTVSADASGALLHRRGYRQATAKAPLRETLAAALVVVVLQRRRLDLVGVDDDTPRLLGVSLSRSRLVFLSLAVLLTATAVAAVGVVGFVGLVAPHAARSLVGRRHARVLPVAVLLGAVLVCSADVLGRTVIVPAQLGAGLLTAVIGTPYFVWLLWRGRASAS